MSTIRSIMKCIEEQQLGELVPHEQLSYMSRTKSDRT